MNKILVIRFSSIGDIVLTSAVVRCLRAQTGAEIHFLTKAAYQSLLQPNPNISKVWVLEDSIGSLLPELKKEGYDYVVDLHKNLRTFRTRINLGRSGKSFPKLNLEKWLITNLKINRLPDQHIVDRYFEAVKSLNVFYDGAGLDHFFPENFRFDPLETLESGVPDDLVCIAIGGAHETKRLPADELAYLCSEIPNQIVLIGGKSEAAEGSTLAKIDPNRIVNLCGLLDLNESAAWIKACRILISHDTGMMHLGAALHRPIISIWGNTIPAFGMYPFYPEGGIKNYIAEVSGLSCRPCSKIGYDSCPKGHFKCMRNQDLQQIVSWVGEETKNS